MDTKKAPCSGRGTREQGQSKRNSILTLDPENVKSDLELFLYFTNTFTRFKLQPVIQKLIAARFPDVQNKNYFKCHRVNRAAIVGLKRNPETFRAYYDGVVSCGNPMHCLVCSPRIMGVRAREIDKAVNFWLAESPNNTCYLITLTLRHFLNDSLAYLLELFKQALVYFWGHRTIKRLLSDSGRVGRITNTEIQFSIKNGWHPHQHILLFCKRTNFELEVLRNIWLSALASVGLSGIGDIAFNLIEARSSGPYLTKLSSEMTLGSLKKGRESGHFSPFELMQEVADGSDWAADRFCELFKASRHLHPLRWSAGLKARFGIGEKSDIEISENKADGSKLVDFLFLLDKSFVKLAPEIKAALRNAAAIGDYDKALALLNFAGVPGLTLKQVEGLQK